MTFKSEQKDHSFIWINWNCYAELQYTHGLFCPILPWPRTVLMSLLFLLILFSFLFHLSLCLCLFYSLLLLWGKDLLERVAEATHKHNAHTHTHTVVGRICLKNSNKKHSSRQNTCSTCRSVTTSNKLLPRHVVVLKTLSAFTNTTSLYECPYLHQMYSMWEGSY